MTVTLSFPLWAPFAAYLLIGLVLLVAMSGALVRDYRWETPEGRRPTVVQAVRRVLRDGGVRGTLRLVLGCVLLWPLLPFPTTAKRVVDVLTLTPGATR